MKGLLIKDLCLLKVQNAAWLVMLGCVVFFMTTGREEFGISYLCAMGALLAGTTISYDEYENGMTFLFAMPVTRKGYVQEKYLFAGITLLTGLGISMVTCGIVSMVKTGSVVWGDLLGYSIGGITAGVVLLAVAVPAQLKYGVEKGRIVLAVIVAALIASGMAAVKFGNGTKAAGYLKKVFDWMDSIGTIGTFGMCMVLWLVIVLVSFLISVRVLKTREF